MRPSDPSGRTPCPGDRSLLSGKVRSARDRNIHVTTTAENFQQMDHGSDSLGWSQRESWQVGFRPALEVAIEQQVPGRCVIGRPIKNLHYSPPSIADVDLMDRQPSKTCERIGKFDMARARDRGHSIRCLVWVLDPSCDQDRSLEDNGKIDHLWAGRASACAII